MDNQKIAGELLKVAKELVSIKTKYNVGDEVVYVGKPAKIDKVREGMYGTVYDISFIDSPKDGIKGTGLLDPRFQAKDSSQVSKRMSILKRELGW